MSEIKNTVLHEWHVTQNANMSAFGGYEMPLWYESGAKQEHLAVIQAAGLFDTSHMALLTLEGKDGLSLLQKTFTKDLEQCIGPKKMPLTEGRCVYGMFLDGDGHVIDDAIVYAATPTVFMLVVNAGMGAVITEHLRGNDSSEQVKITDYTDKLGKIDIQGPNTIAVLQNLLENPEQAFEKFIYFSFKGCFMPGVASEPISTKGGIEILLSRTGYTGEFGVEIFVEAGKAVELWQEILAYGEPFGLTPCGLAARDSLRTGAVLPLSHQDIGPRPFSNTPWDFVLSCNDDGAFTKQFLGGEAIQNIKTPQYTAVFAGYDPRKIIPADGNYVADLEGNRIGTILTCTTDMAVGRVDGEIVSAAQKNPEDGQLYSPKGLSCGFVLTDKELNSGDHVLLVAGKRKIKVEIRKDVRPARTARVSIKQLQEQLNG